MELYTTFGILFLLIWCQILGIKGQLLTIYEITELPFTINSSQLAPYPENENSVDIVWSISLPEVDLILHKLKIETEGGDFVIFAPYPIPSGINNNSVVDEFVEKIVMQDSILLTGEISQDNLPKEYRLKSSDYEGVDYGAYIYFHGHGIYRRNSLKSSLSDSNVTAEPIGTTTKLPKKSSSKSRQTLDLGFEIELNYNETDRNNNSTPEPPSTIPEDYHLQFLWKFLYGKNASLDIPDFKEYLACIATKFIQLDHNNIQVNETDIWMEAFFCDITWPEYSLCVQMKLGILTRDQDNQFIFNKRKLEDLWNQFRDDIENEGYQTLEKELEDFDFKRTHIWVGVFLAVVLFSAFFMCIVWVRYQNERNDRELSEAMSNAMDNNGDRKSSGSSFATKEGPLSNLIKRINNRKDKINYIEMENQEKQFRENEIFNEEDDHELYNRGFVDDDGNEMPSNTSIVFKRQQTKAPSQFGSQTFQDFY